MDTKDIKIIISIINEGNISKVANNFSLTQGGVSHIIKRVEKELGTPLFERSKRGMKANDVALGILEDLKKIEESENNIRNTIAKTSKNRSFTIASFSSVAVRVLPDIIKKFQLQFPDVEISLLSGDYNDIELYLKEGACDVAFDSVTPGAEGNFIPLFKDELLAIVSNSNPLAKEKEITLDKIIKENFITLLDSSCHDFYRVIKRNDVNVKYRSKDDYQVIAMVEKNLGVSIMPKLLLECSNCNNITPLSLKPKAYREIVLRVVKKSPLSDAFVGMCRLRETTNS